MLYSSRLREEHREKLRPSASQPPTAPTTAPTPTSSPPPSLLDLLLLEDGTGCSLPSLVARVGGDREPVSALSGRAVDRAMLIILAIAVARTQPTAESFRRRGDAVDVINAMVRGGCRAAVAAIAAQLHPLTEAMYAPGAFLGLARLELAVVAAIETFHSVSHCQRQGRDCLEVLALVATRSKSGDAVVRAVEMLTCAAFCEENRHTLLSIPGVLSAIARAHPAVQPADAALSFLSRRVEWLALLVGVVKAAPQKEPQALSALLYIAMPDALAVPAATERIPVNQCGRESKPRLCFKLPATPPLPASADPALVPEAIACFKVLHGASLEHAMLLKTRGNGLVASGRHGEAVHVYEVALEALKKLETVLSLQGSKSASAPAEQLVAAKLSLLLNMAQSLLRLGRHAEVVDVSTRAIALQPSNVQARYLRSMARSAIDGPADKAVLDDLLFVRRASENQNSSENQDQRWAHFGLL
jgi:hypothetical protein